MDLNARVDLNCGQKDGRTDGWKTRRLYCTLLKQVLQKDIHNRPVEYNVFTELREQNFFPPKNAVDIKIL